ncbi:VOC family protein [Streptomyces blattellae]|uniref:VOC family protein n=1 Tax=Streptomyces blattellae TaxID=2569855 RepID=UPI0012B879BA|nr:VOC family protein [Streptomyces blattellae]
MAFQISQIALCANDLPAAKSFYMDVFRFEDARSELACGQGVAEVQELGSYASLFINWLTGRQKFAQIEMFQHVAPPQRPLPDDWQVSDIGWGRFGILVTDFDACLSRLAAHGVRTLTDPVELGGQRRFSFRDPYAGIVVEVLEDSAGPADDAKSSLPALANVALSVKDLEGARKFWIDDLGLPEDRDFVIDMDRERLWGFEDADVDGFSVKLNDIRVEIMAYRRPAGRVLDDRLLSDQGIMNIGLGFRDRETLVDFVQRLEKRGYQIPAPIGAEPIFATYMRGHEHVSVEMFSCPEDFEERIGFVARSDMRLF